MNTAKKRSWRTLALAAALGMVGMAGAQNTLKPNQTASGVKFSYYGTYNLTFKGCHRISTENLNTECEVYLLIQDTSDSESFFQANSSFSLISLQGDQYIATMVKVGNGEFVTETKYVSRPKIGFTVIYRLNYPKEFASAKYMDVGSSNYGRVRFEDVSIGGASAGTPLPQPQPATQAPNKNYISRPYNGVTTIPGVTLNGGLYNVTLYGCSPTADGNAVCTLALLPAQTLALDVQLEDLAVTVGGNKVQAKAVSYPTITTIQITAPVSGGRVDVLQVGNARFTGVVVR